MKRREMAIQATVVLSLVCGIVGGNFVLHRWVIGNAASREAGAGTEPAGLPQEDLDEFAPVSRAISRPAATNDPAVHRERLRKLIAVKLPTSTEVEREAWFEELSDVSLGVAEGILDLRGRVGAFPQIDDSATPRTSPVKLPRLIFSVGVPEAE
jgi:hypothetical protein